MNNEPKYEYKLVGAQQINMYLDQGWEPVPDTHEVVTNRSAPDPFVQVYLRRRINE